MNWKDITSTELAELHQLLKLETPTIVSNELAFGTDLVFEMRLGKIHYVFCLGKGDILTPDGERG